VKKARVWCLPITQEAVTGNFTIPSAKTGGPHTQVWRRGKLKTRAGREGVVRGWRKKKGHTGHVGLGDSAIYARMQREKAEGGKRKKRAN